MLNDPRVKSNMYLSLGSLHSASDMVEPADDAKSATRQCNGKADLNTNAWTGLVTGGYWVKGFGTY
jgi:hypothetical protein